jgi:hypothetical protein
VKRLSWMIILTTCLAITLTGCGTACHGRKALDARLYYSYWGNQFEAIYSQAETASTEEIPALQEQMLEVEETAQGLVTPTCTHRVRLALLDSFDAKQELLDLRYQGASAEEIDSANERVDETHSLFLQELEALDKRIDD